MPHRIDVRISALRSAAIALVIGCGALTASAAADRVYFSGPSIARAGAEQVFSGAKFKPNLPVTIMVKAPDGQESGYSAVTGADGSLTHAVLPDRRGLYLLRVLDATGAVIVKAQLNVVN